MTHHAPRIFNTVAQVCTSLAKSGQTNTLYLIYWYICSAYLRIEMLDCCSTTASEASHLLGVSLAKAHSHLILRSQHVTHKPRDIFLYLMSCRILDLHAIVHCSTKDDKNCGHKSSKPRPHNSHNLKYMGNCIYIYDRPTTSCVVLSSSMHAVASASTRARIHAWQVMQPSKLGMRQ